jgi:integrase
MAKTKAKPGAEDGRVGKARRGRGEGGVRWREDVQLWEVCVSLGANGAGKRRRKKEYAKTKSEALKKLDELKAKVSTRTLGDAGKQTASAFLTWWLDNVSKKETEATTWERYEQLVRLHVGPHLGSTKLANLTVLHVEQLYADMEKAGSSTWNRRMAGTLLANALGYAVRKKLIPFNPAADVAKPKPEHHEIRPLTEEQVKKFLGKTRPHRLHALFALALGGGLRQGELLGLSWECLDIEKGTVTVKRSLAQTKQGFKLKQPKSQHGRRTIGLPPFVVEALKAHRERMREEGHAVEGDATVFCTRNGTWIAKSNLTRYTFRPLLKKAELAVIRFHDLRHTHATGLLRRGMSIKAVSRRLGHSTVELTLRVYVHVLPADDHELAKAAQAMCA